MREMTRFAIVLLGLTNLISARPTFLPVPLTYATPLISGTQVGTNGGAPDNPEISIAHINERTSGVVRSTTESQLRSSSSSLIRDGVQPTSTSSAPLGADGRVVDTPEVAAAKAAHAAAHVNERINLANEVARSSGDVSDSSDVVNSNSNGRVLDAPEVATRIDGKINLVKEVASSGDDLTRIVGGRVVPLVLGNGVVAALMPVGPDGRPLDVPEVVARGDQNLSNDVRSVDALAVAGSTLAYGRLVY
ncbi:hypothetical protein P5V15_011065 [Pogonomyrmex californicus]